MKTIALATLALFCIIFAKAQTVDPNHKFAPAELKMDLTYLKTQLFNAHASPFSEISRAGYEKVFDNINRQLTDSMTATAYFKVIRPASSYLSDEHAQISLPAALQTDEYKNGAIFLPVTLAKKGNNYIVDEQLVSNTGLQKGEAITQINGQLIAALINKYAHYTTGFPEQRATNALQQFGYLQALAAPVAVTDYQIKTGSGKTLIVKGTQYKTWFDYLVNKAGQAGRLEKTLTYTRYGDAGYINATAFDARNDKQADSVKKVIANIFRQIKADGVKDLFIDVSKNGGGNSQVGSWLIDYFYSKPYRTYQCNWKRSDEYLALMKSWGVTDVNYAAQPAGKVIHFDSSEDVPFNPNPDRFTGKVYVVIGNGTFSSAIMFATVIKDNHIATLVGQIPSGGHPTHFGEVYSTKLPNTRLDVRFGVKEWIRPAGKSMENVLRPDIAVDLDKANTPEGIIKAVVK